MEGKYPHTERFPPPSRHSALLRMPLPLMGAFPREPRVVWGAPSYPNPNSSDTLLPTAWPTRPRASAFFSVFLYLGSESPVAWLWTKTFARNNTESKHPFQPVVKNYNPAGEEKASKQKGVQSDIDKKRPGQPSCDPKGPTATTKMATRHPSSPPEGVVPPPTSLAHLVDSHSSGRKLK